MKAIITIIFAVLSFLTSYGQDLKLSVIKNSDEPNTETEHFYLLGVTNTSNKAASFSISASNELCADKKLKYTDFSHEILNNKKVKQDEQLKIQPGETIEVFVKMNRSKNSSLNTWNCTEVKAISSNNRLLSNVITIESLIPDPKEFN